MLIEFALDTGVDLVLSVNTVNLSKMDFDGEIT